MESPIHVNKESAIAKVFGSGEPIFVEKAISSPLIDTQLALRYGLDSIAFEPFENGVIQYGTDVLAQTGAPPPHPGPPFLPPQHSLTWSHSPDVSSPASHCNSNLKPHPDLLAFWTSRQA